MTLGHLDELPRLDLHPYPTPIEKMQRLTDTLGGANLWIKRDDVQALAFGGNKVRQLNYYFGAAVAEGADTILITGAVQSNFCRLAAAFSAKLGLECHIQQEERVDKNDPNYRNSGNVLVEKLLGARFHSLPIGEDEDAADRNLAALAEDLRSKGKKPYLIHLSPGHPPLGALGYIDAAREILSQLDETGLKIDHIAVASGSGSTHGGLLFGLRALGNSIPVTGFCVRRPAELQGPRIEKRCSEIANYLGIENPVPTEDVVVNDSFYGPSYGVPNDTTREAILLGARCEAIMLDPVYTGKSMAGAVHLARTLPRNANILFIHTGGTPGLFAYSSVVDELV